MQAKASENNNAQPATTNGNAKEEKSNIYLIEVKGMHLLFLL